MATTQKGGATEATCPLCDDYSGKPSSVEAHISRMTDPIHQGEVGRAHRDDLHRQVEATDGVESSDDRAVETTDEGTTGPDFRQVGGLPSEDHDTTDEDVQGGGDVPTDDELDRQRSKLVEDADDQEDADGQLEDRDDHADDLDGELPGIPVEAVAVAMVVAFGVYWFVFRDSGGGQEQDEQQAQQSQQTAPGGFGDGLVEGV